MPRYQDFSKTAQQPLNYLGQNTGVSDPTGSKSQSTSSFGDLKDLFGDMSQQGAVDFAKNLFGGGSGYADTIAKWQQLSQGAKGFAGAGAGGAGGAGGALGSLAMW
jgi:hypothetical protein